MNLPKDFLNEELLKAADLLNLDQSTGLFLSFLPTVIVLSSNKLYRNRTMG